MANAQTINILSLCTGYGGLEIGLSRALEGFFRVVAVEVEAYALANLAEKAKEGKLAIEAMWPDLKTFPAERFRGCFDFVLAGYPCQPFSVAGKRKGTADPRHLWPYIARIVQAVRPVWCFFENVSGHLSIGFPEVYRSLRLMGYKVEAGLFTAAEVGAPHRRQRLFILANSCRAASRNQNGQVDGRTRQEDVPQGNGQAGTIRLGATSELAYTEKHNRRPAKRGVHTASERESSSKGLTDCRWPARPGQPQYEWEEPRVVDDSRKQKPTRLSGDERQTISETGKTSSRTMDDTKFGDKRAVKFDIRQGERKIDKHRGAVASRSETEGQTESRLGMSANGNPCGLGKTRIDELRLLGNGVVPQQAELAFRELIKLF